MTVDRKPNYCAFFMKSVDSKKKELIDTCEDIRFGCDWYGDICVNVNRGQSLGGTCPRENEFAEKLNSQKAS